MLQVDSGDTLRVERLTQSFSVSFTVNTPFVHTLKHTEGLTFKVL